MYPPFSGATVTITNYGVPLVCEWMSVLFQDTTSAKEVSLSGRTLHGLARDYHTGYATHTSTEGESTKRIDLLLIVVVDFHGEMGVA